MRGVQLTTYTQRDIETLKKLITCSCVRSTNGHWQNLPDMANSGTIKRLVRLGLAEYIYKKDGLPGYINQTCWTGLGRLTEKGKKVLEEHSA
jgi:hypothetical protein